MDHSNYTSLMSKRVRRILLVCNNYDSFALEEDGRIEVQIAQEYAELNLSNPPSIVRAETTREALDLIKANGERTNGETYDLILTMYSVGELDVFDFAREAKQLLPECPIVLLSAFSKEIYNRIEQHDRSDIDYFFNWNNSTDLIIAIIKAHRGPHECAARHPGGGRTRHPARRGLRPLLLHLPAFALQAPASAEHHRHP